MARLLRRPEVEKRVGLSTSAIYRRMAEDRFPRPVRLGSHAVAWRESDIDAWIDALPQVTADTNGVAA